MNKFPGFPPEGQYWQFPTIINGFVNILSGSEFKILWYVLRHTYGYQKDHDAISVSQLMNGIKKRDGTVVDAGTGIKNRKTIMIAIKNLIGLDFVAVKKERGRINVYYPQVVPKNGTRVVPKITTPTSTKNRYTTINNSIDNNNMIIKDESFKKAKERIKNNQPYNHLLDELDRRYAGWKFVKEWGEARKALFS